MHTFKNQFIVLPNGEDIVDVIVGKLGKTSDINLFRASRDKLTPNKVLGDKAKEMRQLQRLTKKNSENRNYRTPKQEQRIVFSKNRC